MIVKYDSALLKRLKKIDVKIRKRFKERLEIFIRDQTNLQLRSHELHDEWKGYRSIDLTNDWRALYIEKTEGDETIAYFVAIGTHDQLFKQKSS